MEGYSSSSYAEALSEFGRPLRLDRSGGNALVREIPATGLADAMGPYPLFTCERWSELRADVDALTETGLVSLTLVPDPFAPITPAELNVTFDRVVPFKPHYVYDLSMPLATSTSRHHRYYARRASKTVSFAICPDPIAFADEWTELYRVLATRHGLQGMKAFSASSFRQQLGVPGMVAIRGDSSGELVAGQLWFVQGDVAYSHLTAVSERGYEARASYALYAFAIDYFAEAFRGRVRWLDLGGGAGAGGDSTDGLSEFKKGWSTGVRQAYLCGRTLQPVQYAALCRARGAEGASYFPAYRAGEMTAPTRPSP